MTKRIPGLHKIITAAIKRAHSLGKSKKEALLTAVPAAPKQTVVEEPVAPKEVKKRKKKEDNE